MIFQYTLPQVLDGTKTQTRRRALPTHEAIFDNNGCIVEVKMNGRRKWCVGRTYAVQPGRTQKSVARVRLRGIRLELARVISEGDACAEGATDRKDFLETWQHIHGEKHADAEAWVLEFELVAAG